MGNSIENKIAKAKKNIPYMKRLIVTVTDKIIFRKVAFQQMNNGRWVEACKYNNKMHRVVADTEIGGVYNLFDAI